MKTKTTHTPGSEGLTVTNGRNKFGVVTVVIRDALTSEPLLCGLPSVILAAPELLAVAKFQQAYDEGEPWAVEDVDRMLTDNEGRDYRTPAQLFMFQRCAAILRAEGPK